MVNLPRAPLSYGALSIHRFHQGASLCWSSGLADHTRVAVAARPRHWGESTLQNYPRIDSAYIRLRSCAPQRPTSGGTHPLRRVTSRVNCQKWTQTMVPLPRPRSTHKRVTPTLSLACKHDV